MYYCSLIIKRHHTLIFKHTFNITMLLNYILFLRLYLPGSAVAYDNCLHVSCWNDVLCPPIRVTMSSVHPYVLLGLHVRFVVKKYEGWTKQRKKEFLNWLQWLPKIINAEQILTIILILNRIVLLVRLWPVGSHFI